VDARSPKESEVMAKRWVLILLSGISYEEESIYISHVPSGE
jgi:hypothetical protein